MKIHFDAVHADIGDDAAGRDDFLTKLECRGNADSLDGGVDSAPVRQLEDRFRSPAIGAVDCGEV